MTDLTPEMHILEAAHHVQKAAQGFRKSAEASYFKDAPEARYSAMNRKHQRYAEARQVLHLLSNMVDPQALANRIDQSDPVHTKTNQPTPKTANADHTS